MGCLQVSMYPQAWIQLEVTVNKCVRPEEEMSANQGGVDDSSAMPHVIIMLDAPYSLAAATAAALVFPLGLRGHPSQKHTAWRERIQNPCG